MTYVAHEWAREPSEPLSKRVDSGTLTRENVAPRDFGSQDAKHPDYTTHFSQAIGLAIALRHFEFELGEFRLGEAQLGGTQLGGQQNDMAGHAVKPLTAPGKSAAPARPQ